VAGSSRPSRRHRRWKWPGATRCYELVHGSTFGSSDCWELGWRRAPNPSVSSFQHRVPETPLLVAAAHTASPMSPHRSVSSSIPLEPGQLVPLDAACPARRSLSRTFGRSLVRPTSCTSSGVGIREKRDRARCVRRVVVIGPLRQEGSSSGAAPRARHGPGASACMVDGSGQENGGSGQGVDLGCPGRGVAVLGLPVDSTAAGVASSTIAAIGRLRCRESDPRFAGYRL
jgi:hypothetical protein